MTDTEKHFLPNGKATLIGSLPVNDYETALQWIFEHTPDIPLWPQLPSNPLEGMMIQFVEGFPGIVEDPKRTFFNTTTPEFESEQLTFFEEYLGAFEDPDLLQNSRFAVSPQRAEGIYKLREACRNKTDLTAVKGQITGPFTLLTGLSDQDHKLGYYDALFREVAVKGLSLKAAWQVQHLKELGLPVLIFIDEPALAGLGSSAFISIATDTIAEDLSEVIGAIQNAGGLAGIHVCANTDWNFLLSLPLNILSFDAYGYFDKLIVAKDQLISYLDRGGYIAWGIVPTQNAETIDGETSDTLMARWEDQARMLCTDTWDMTNLLERTMITPSCGTGALSGDSARKVLLLTKELSEKLRAKYAQSK